jgi:hypothetical protein
MHVLSRARTAALAVFTAALLQAAPAWSTTRSVSPGGADSGGCVSAPCATFGYAYGQSAAGDIINVAAGAYGRQSVPAGSTAVTFRGGLGVVLRQMVNDASNVTYDGINVDAGGVQTDGAAFELGGNGTTVKNASIGNVVDEKAMLASGANLTVDNVTFHDAVYRTDGTHMECLYAIGVPGFTIRNSTFRDCAVMDLFFTYGTWWSPLPPSYGNVTVENNVFAHPERENNGGWHFYSLFINFIGPNGPSDPMSNWVIRNNTFESPASITPERGADGTRWVGNLGSWDCRPGISYRYNVGDACGTTDKRVEPSSSTAEQNAAFRWADPADYDFTLSSGSPAINSGTQSDSPTVDRRGLARDSRPDAGAYEFGAKAGDGGVPSVPTVGLRILSARLKPRTICVRPRRGCPGATKLRVAVTGGARVAVRVKRLRAGHRPRRVRSFGFHVAGHRTTRIKTGRLKPGRYRVIVRAQRAGTRTRARGLALRVR